MVLGSSFRALLLVMYHLVDAVLVLVTPRFYCGGNCALAICFCLIFLAPVVNPIVLYCLENCKLGTIWHLYYRLAVAFEILAIFWFMYTDSSKYRAKMEEIWLDQFLAAFGTCENSFPYPSE